MNRVIRAASGGLLTFGAAVMASPIVALAATPEGTTGGSGIVPGPDPVSGFIDVVLKAGAIAAVIAILVALGYGVALVGGQRVATTAAGVDRPGWRRGRTAIVLVASSASFVGVLTGREIAHARSVGGLGAILGSAILTLIVIAAVVGLVVVGLVATKFRHGQVSSAIASLLAAAALLTVGTIGGGVAASALGGLHHEPVILEARGTTSIEMRPGGAPFVAKNGGMASCHSTADGLAVGDLTALELGELGSGTLRAMLDVTGRTSAGGPGGTFLIDGADIPEGAAQPTWNATIVIVETAPDGASGKLTFDGRADAGAEKDPGATASSSTASAWPAAIAGTISWSCDSW